MAKISRNEKDFLPHNRFGLPVSSRPAPPAGLRPQDAVWAVLPYPSHPGKYRLAPGVLLRLDPAGALVENNGIRTADVPYSMVFPRRKSPAKPGDIVLAAGQVGIYAGRVVRQDENTLHVERIWRERTREETVQAQDVIVQKGTREPGQIVFYLDQGQWSQGVLLLLEERHAWVQESFGGAVLRVGESEIEPWDPHFAPREGDMVDACRGASSHVVKAKILFAHPSRLSFDILFSSGSSRRHVPLWEMLPAGRLLD